MRLTYAGVDEIQHVLNEHRGCPPNKLRPAHHEINRLHLLDHNESSQRRTAGNPEMKRITSIRVSHRADYRQPRMSVEQVVADNQRRPSSLLLVACLRIK